ncbi:MAG TPA: glycine--tRNA ligase subunit beta [Terriglobia bacterium]|nr:glycine--tRNA ligase subunit beta [Terriglobia bacterium]
MSQATLPLLVEIGCEEIPARFLRDAERQFGERLLGALRDSRLLPDLGSSEQRNGDSPAPELRSPKPAATTYSTPRRLVVHIVSVLPRQSDLEEQVMGPAAKIAFDASGKPTRAAENFAAKNGVAVEELLQVETAKGLYMAARKATSGRPAAEVLSDVLPRVIKSVAFPKSMVWETTGVRFVRPLRWILALLGEGDRARSIHFDLAGVRSGKHTRGHRGSGAGRLDVVGFADYAQKLRQHFVEFDPESRRQSVRSEANVVLEAWQEAVADPELEEWVVNSTEWVAGLRGSFDPRFLKLPREILVTVMRDHQKYFAVEDRESKLQPNFVAMLNRDRDATGAIRAGHERVLTARFNDAEFFWNADQKVPLAQRFADGWLERVTYQAKLGDQGSYAAKIFRMKALAEQVCAGLEGQGRLAASQRAHVLHALELCKCDLTTQMVQEFTELQGVVGGLYARAQGEPPEVAEAIYDHYKPVHIEGDCPRSVVGAVVSLADKLDAVIAGFAAGLEPTGSSDPFALRRAGNGIVKLAVESLHGLDLTILVNQTLRSHATVLGAQAGLDSGELAQRVDVFLREERMEFYFREVGALRYDTVRAIVKRTKILQDLVPSAALARGRALERVRDTDDFLALAAAAKRTRNIRKSANILDISGGRPDPGLFSEDAERELYAAYEGLSREIQKLSDRGEFEEAFRATATIRPHVDRFFDKVLVMSEDPSVRRNRLMLLLRLNEEVFTSLADLSEIEPIGAEGGKARNG